MNQPAPEDTRENASPQSPSQRSRRLPRLLAVAALLIFGGWLVPRIFFIRPLPAVTPAALEKANRTWQAQSPRNYDIAVTVHGDRIDVFELQIRDGQPQRVLRNGQPVTEHRMLDVWSVPGMFNTIAEDLALVQAVRTGTAPANAPQLRLWCQFDTATGIPLKYRRLDWQQGLDVSWEVTNFVTSTTSDP